MYMLERVEGADLSGWDGYGQLVYAPEGSRPIPPCPAASLVVH